MSIVTEHIQKAKEYQRDKQFDLAITEFTNAIQLEPKNVEAYYWRGFCFYQMKDYENALNDFNTTIQYKNDHAKAYYWRGLSYMGVEEEQKASTSSGALRAIADFNQAIKLNPNDMFCYYRKAEVLYKINEFENAQQDLEKAIQINPNYVSALLLMAKIKYKLGENFQVLETLDKLIKTNQNQPESYKYRALAKYKLKYFDSCLEDLDKAANIYQQQGKTPNYQEIQDLIQSVSHELELLRSHVSVKTLDTLNLDKQKKNLDELIKKDNPIVYKFDQDMIKTYLKKNEIKRYLQDSEGDLVIKFGYDKRIDCELTVYLMVSGSKKNIYSISVRSDKRIPKKLWDQAVLLCNQWNLQSRWPTACFSLRNTEDKYGSIFLEYHLDLDAGIHQQLLDNVTSQVISAGYRFWYSTNKHI